MCDSNPQTMRQEIRLQDRFVRLVNFHGGVFYNVADTRQTTRRQTSMSLTSKRDPQVQLSFCLDDHSWGFWNDERVYDHDGTLTLWITITNHHEYPRRGCFQRKITELYESRMFERVKRIFSMPYLEEHEFDRIMGTAPEPEPEPEPPTVSETVRSLNARAATLEKYLGLTRAA